MAKNSIDGDVLIAAHKKTGFVENFCKHYDYHATLSGKTPIIFYATLVLALICGIIAYFLDGNNNIFSAVFAATCITGIAAIPTAFLIDTLPLTSAAKKLNDKDQKEIQKIRELCDQFISANVYVIAAPMWTLSFPAPLKEYIDCIMQNEKTIKFNSIV
jgi:hypothetical protein